MFCFISDFCLCLRVLPLIDWKTQKRKTRHKQKLNNKDFEELMKGNMKKKSLNDFLLKE